MQNIAAQTNGLAPAPLPADRNALASILPRKIGKSSRRLRAVPPQPNSNSADVKTVCRRRLWSSAPRSTVFLQGPQMTTHKNESAIFYGLRMNHNGDRRISQFFSAQFC